MRRRSLLASSHEFALRYRVQVSELVLVGPAATGFPYSEYFLMRERANSQSNKVEDLIEASVRDVFLIVPGHDAARKHLRDLLAASPQDLTHDDMPLPEKSVFPYVQELRVPTLILIGSGDIADNQAVADALVMVIPGATRVGCTRYRAFDVSGKTSRILLGGGQFPDCPRLLKAALVAITVEKSRLHSQRDCEWNRLISTVNCGPSWDISKAFLSCLVRYRSPDERHMPKELPAEIVALINEALDAFNRKDSAVFNSVFGGDVVIIDGFAPFRWVGPGAEARWWADAETWGKAGGVLKEHISFETTRCCEVSGTRAYAVLSATLTITLKAGEPVVRPRILAYTFARQGDVWKAEGQTWGRLSSGGEISLLSLCPAGGKRSTASVPSIYS